MDSRSILSPQTKHVWGRLVSQASATSHVDLTRVSEGVGGGSVLVPIGLPFSSFPIQFIFGLLTLHPSPVTLSLSLSLSLSVSPSISLSIYPSISLSLSYLHVSTARTCTRLVDGNLVPSHLMT